MRREERIRKELKSWKRGFDDGAASRSSRPHRALWIAIGFVFGSAATVILLEILGAISETITP